jgi:hypothetical protein
LKLIYVLRISPDAIPDRNGHPKTGQHQQDKRGRIAIAMSQHETNQEDDFQKRELELRERELAIRVRELEAELQDQQRADTAKTSEPIVIPIQRSKTLSPREIWELLKIGGFFVFGLFSVIFVVQYSVLIAFLLVGSGLSWVAYHLFWKKLLP